jgi:hypothetical protein
MTDLACTIEATHRFWEYIGYFGQGRLSAFLCLNQLQVIKRARFDAKTRELVEAYPAIFYKGNKPASVNMQPNSQTTVEITYATRPQRQAEAVATAVTSPRSSPRRSGHEAER